MSIKLNKISKPVKTLYFGGGTPSFLEIKDLELLVKRLSEYFSLDDLDEFTFETNPDDMSETNLKAWKSLGVTRLSVGVQSFFDEHLTWMNRAHSAAEADAGIKLAQDLGFDLSLDLIFGVPGSTNQQHQQNLEKALSYSIQHLSCYGLTLEEKTPWKRLIKSKGYASPDDSLGAEQFMLTMDFLRERGWIQYEISNYCLPGKMAIHNTSYWRNETYMGFGPSAHSFDGVRRSWNISDLKTYSEALKQGLIPEESEVLSAADHFNEYVMTSLRTIWGLSSERLHTFDVNHSEVLSQLKHYVEKGMLLERDGTFVLTDKGKFYADAISSDLFVA